MNFTIDYQDELDGDYLACKPGDVALGLEGICTIVMPFAGGVMLFNGLWLICLVCIQRRHRKVLVRQKQHIVTNVSTFRVSKKLRPPQSHGGETFSYLEKLLFSIGVSAVSTSMMILVNGWGTMYPTSHIRGQVGDVAATIATSVLWYMSLLQYQGAIAFKSFIQEPSRSMTHISLLPPSRFQMLSISPIFDAAQSWLAPVIAFVLWGLLSAGIYTRGWFLFILLSLHGVFGVRTFACIVLQRLTTLKRIVNMVNAKAGSGQQKYRRRVFLAKQFIGLVLELGFVLCVSVILPISMIILGSTFNSRQMVIHSTILILPVLAMLTAINIYIHFNFNKSRNISGSGVHDRLRSSAKRGSAKARWRVVPSEGETHLQHESSVAMQSDV